MGDGQWRSPRVGGEGMKKFKAVIPFDAATNTPIMSYIMYDSLDHS